MNLHSVIMRNASTCIGLWAFIFFVPAPKYAGGQNQGIRVESSFQPSILTLSNTTLYKIVIHGTQENPQGKIPKVSWLNLSNNPQTFRSASFVNGVPSVRIELSLRAKPNEIGEFVFPTWNLTIGQNSFVVPQASLSVLAPNQQDLVRQRELKNQQEDLSQAAFIDFSNPRPFLYEGETVAGEIQLFLWDRFPVTRIEESPVKKGDAFSMTEVSQPLEQRNVIRFNKSYSVYSWPVGLTAATAGENEISFSANIRVRSENRGRSPFNSPFFNDPFFGFARDESVRVLSEVKNIEVRPLPVEGRPSGFQGAVGSFTIRSSIDLDRVSLGDPVRLTMTLSGSGNFAAMPAPLLKQSSDFKIGPPAFSFTGNDQTKHQGEQNFEYVLTPLSAGLLNTPGGLFSYFDPIMEKFFTITGQSHAVRVDPGEKWIDATSTSSKESAGARISTSDLFQTESEPGKWQESLATYDLSKSGMFWTLQSIPLAGFVYLIFLGFQKRNGIKTNRKQNENILLQRMKDSVDNRDSVTFFRTFRDLLRMKIGALNNHSNPSSLSSSELLAELQLKKAYLDLVDPIKGFLRKCDDYEFAGNESHSVELNSELEEAMRIYKKIR